LRRQLRLEDASLLEPHDHVIWYGEGTDDLYPLASAALAAGAARNERLVFVAEDPDPAQLGVIRELDRLRASGQLVIQSIEDVYGTPRSFSQAAQLETFEGVLADALTDGYSGITVVADNTPLARGSERTFHTWLCWEQVTDAFQAAFSVTGVCYFDRRALSPERQADLAAIHPVRSAGSLEPPFCFFVEDGAVSVTGTLDLFSADVFRRVLATTPADRPLIVDLARTEFVDHRALLALASVASATRPVRIRAAPEPIRALPALLELATPYLAFE
jgi:hypothetical protein